MEYRRETFYEISFYDETTYSATHIDDTVTSNYKIKRNLKLLGFLVYYYYQERSYDMFSFPLNDKISSWDY